MEELFAELMGALTDRLETLTDVVNIDSIMDNASDAVHSMVDTISDQGLELDDATRESLVEKLAEVISGDPQSILDNLTAIADNPLDFLQEASQISSTEVNFSTENIGEAAGNGKNISFTSIGCWDECFASTKDHGKRLTCGYQY